MESVGYTKSQLQINIMKITERKVVQPVAWVIYLLLFAFVLLVPNQFMSITEVGDGPGAAVVGLMSFMAFVEICVLFVFIDLFFHLLLRHNKFRLTAIILLLSNGIYKTVEYYFVYSGYESGKRLSENIYENVPTADVLVFFYEINSIILMYLVTMILLSKLWRYWSQR